MLTLTWGFPYPGTGHGDGWRTQDAGGRPEAAALVTDLFLDYPSSSCHGQGSLAGAAWGVVIWAGGGRAEDVLWQSSPSPSPAPAASLGPSTHVPSPFLMALTPHQLGGLMGKQGFCKKHQFRLFF